MSEFKRGLATYAVSAAIAVGSFVASEEMSIDYNQEKQKCAEQYRVAEEVESCEANVGRDQSGALEVIAYLGMIGTLIGGYRMFNAVDDK